MRFLFLFLGAILCLAFTPTSVVGGTVPSNKPVHYPDWWFEYDVIPRIVPVGVSPTWPADYPEPDDYAVANIGQLKHIATRAGAAFEAILPAPGNGSPINNMLLSWTEPQGVRDDYAAINLGQLKMVAEPFHTRLIQLGIADNYPWGQGVGDDYALANLGQLKNVFSFNLESNMFVTPLVYIKSQPQLASISSNSFYSQPLVLKVRNRLGMPLPDLSLDIRVRLGSFTIARTEVLPSSTQLLSVITNSVGEVTIFLCSGSTFTMNNRIGVALAGESTDFGFVDLPIFDYEPPSPPSNLLVEGLSNNSTTLSWNEAGDDFGVAGYRIYRDGALVATVLTNSYTDTGLTAGAFYTYKVTAYDFGGKESEFSNTRIGVAAASGILSAPQNLTGSIDDVNSVRLTWSPAAANQIIDGYQILMNGAVIAVTATREWIVRDLNCSTSYSFSVRALSGETVSGASNVATITTQSADGIAIIPGAQHMVVKVGTEAIYGTGPVLYYGTSSGWDDRADSNIAKTLIHLRRFSHFQKAGGGFASLLEINNQGIVAHYGVKIFGDANINSEPTIYPTLANKTINDLGGGAASTQYYAIEQGGKIWAWGQNEYRQLGYSTGVSNTPSTSPSMVLLSQNGLPFTDGVEVQGGRYVSYARKGNGQVWAWGIERYMGVNSVGTNPRYPAQVGIFSGRTNQITGSVSNATKIAAGLNFGLVLRKGYVFAWGDNTKGQCGNNSSTFNPLALDVWSGPLGSITYLGGNASTDATGNIIDVSAGLEHGLALSSTGVVWSWGSNSSSQLGNTSAANRKWAVPVSFPTLGGATIIKVAAGGNSSYALDSFGRIWAWGDNQYGQLGLGETAGTTVTVPTQAHKKDRSLHFIDIDDSQPINSRIYISSESIDAQIKYTTDGSTPTSGSTTLPAGQSLVLTGPTLIKARTYRGTIPVGDMFQKYYAPNRKIFAGPQSAGYITSDGKLRAWGKIGPAVNKSHASEVNLLGSVAQTTFGNDHVLMRKTSGQLLGYGYNASGQLSEHLSSMQPTFEPSVLLSGSLVRAAVAGYANSFAIDNNGDLWSWGNNLEQVLGQSTSLRVNKIPAKVVNTDGQTLNRFLSIVAGPQVAYALTENFELWGWGSPLGLQFPPEYALPASESRARVLKWRDITKVSTAANLQDVNFLPMTLALRADGTLWSWGTNIAGQLALGRVDAYGLIQAGQCLEDNGTTEGTALTSVIDFAAGGNHGIALKSNGTVWTWGANQAGALGAPVSEIYRTKAKQVAGLPEIVAVAAGNDFCMAQDITGDVWMWGRNDNGELANGGFTSNHIPQKIMGVIVHMGVTIPNNWITANGIIDLDSDADADGLVNYLEYSLGTNPHAQDSDGDGLLDNDELTIFGTNPAFADAFAAKGDYNGDGMPDAFGLQLGISPYNMDSDGDGLSNAQERAIGTDPGKADTDGDNVNDSLDYYPLDNNIWSAPVSDASPGLPPVIHLISPSGKQLYTTP